ncbi:MAG: Trp family transcriptional regulator [Parcubacteria group bacterium]|jgi:uncharacterized protein YerC
MAKHHTKLSKKEVERIFYQLCLAISRTKNINIASKLLRDLLSYQEAEMLAKRLKIAELVLEGDTYSQIRESLKVSPGTIARIQEWLKISGDGYRWAVQKTRGDMKKIKENISVESGYSGWSEVKRRYPMYFWPELILEEIVKNANKREKERLKKVIGEMNKIKTKKPLFEKLKRILQ